MASSWMSLFWKAPICWRTLGDFGAHVRALGEEDKARIVHIFFSPRSYLVAMLNERPVPPEAPLVVRLSLVYRIPTSAYLTRTSQVDSK